MIDDPPSVRNASSWSKSWSLPSCWITTEDKTRHTRFCFLFWTANLSFWRWKSLDLPARHPDILRYSQIDCQSKTPQRESPNAKDVPYTNGVVQSSPRPPGRSFHFIRGFPDQKDPLFQATRFLAFPNPTSTGGLEVDVLVPHVLLGCALASSWKSGMTGKWFWVSTIITVNSVFHRRVR